MFPGNIGPPEMLVIMLVAVLIFGKRLPEVGRSLGKGIVEFKRGLRGEGDPGDDPFASTSTSSSTTLAKTSAEAPPAPEYTVPKFEPPSSPPTVESTPASPYET